MFQLFRGNGKTITWESFDAISALMALQPVNLHWLRALPSEVPEWAQ